MENVYGKDTIKERIGKLLEETIQFDFPFLASADKKADILDAKRKYIETELKNVATSQYPSNESIDKIWRETVEYTDEQFKSLPNGKRLNGFYLQELMHKYVEKLGEVILLTDMVKYGKDS